MALTSRALAFASRWFDAATVQRTFEPLIADWQREWQDAPPARRARVSVRGLAAFISACIVCVPEIARAKAPSDVTSRVAQRMARFTLLASALLFVPLSRELEPAWISDVRVLFLIPALLTVAFPFAVIGAIDTIRAERTLPEPVQRATAAKLALLAMAVMMVFTGFVIPAANQAWRVEMNPHPNTTPARGTRELTTWELLAHPERARSAEHPRGVGTVSNAPSARADGIRREFNNRASLILLPVLLLWRRWSALAIAPGRWFSPLPSWLATLAMVFGFLALRFNDWFAEQILNLPAGGAAWLPLLILVSAGMIRVKWAAMQEGRA